MHMLTKEQNAQALLGEEWKAALGHVLPLSLPGMGLGGEQESWADLQAALRQAEQIIGEQEDRIRELESLAQTDELTCLANRRGFRVAFERELALARRDASCGGILIMADLDGFKNINDRYGHQAGDAYLCAVAAVLQESVRASDIVARLGGDEFAILLTRMDEDYGVKRLAKLERVFNSRSIIWNGKRLPLRASFGLAVYNGAFMADAVINAADMRLYARKARNRMLVSTV